MGRRKKGSDNAVSLFSFQDVLACLTGVLIMVSLLLCIDGLSSNINMAKGAQAAGQPMDMTAQVERLTQEVAVLRKAVEDRKGGVDVSKQVVDVLDDRVKQVAEEAEKAKRRDDALAAELAARNKELAKLREEEAAAKDAATAATRSALQVELRERVRFRAGQTYQKAPVFVEVGTGRLVVGELDASRTPILVARLEGADAENRLVGALGKRMPDTSYIVFVVHQDAIPRFESLRDAMFRRGCEVGWQLWADPKGRDFLDGAEQAKGTAP